VSFFIAVEPYKREITAPDGEKGEVTMRRLNAGDQAAIQDTLRMTLGDETETSLAMGTMRMLSVQRAVLDWSWPGPKPSSESISQLEPEVFEQIYSFVEIGTPPTPAPSTAGTEAPTEPGETETALTLSLAASNDSGS